jgi:hypothetical protein
LVDTLIQQDCRVGALQLRDAVRIGKPAVISIVHDLGYIKVSAQGVLEMLTEEQKEARKAIYQ